MEIEWNNLDPDQLRDFCRKQKQEGSANDAFKRAIQKGGNQLTEIYLKGWDTRPLGIIGAEREGRR